MIPPLNEQRRIVAKIEELFSELDAGVAALKRVRAGLKRYRAAVLKAAVEGKLTEDWRAQHPDTEPASVLLEHILTERRRKWEEAQLAKFAQAGQQPPKTRREQYGPNYRLTDSSSDLPSSTWSWTGIEPLLAAGRRGMKTGPFGSLLKKHEHRTDGIHVLGIENIQSMRFASGSKIHITTAKAEELREYEVHPGDVLVSRSGTALSGIA